MGYTDGAHFPITLSAKEARQILSPERGCPDGVCKISDQIMKTILAAELTPLQAQAVLVRAWSGILKNARFCFSAKARQALQSQNSEE